MRWILILGIACALAMGCESSSGDGASGGTLVGTKWRLTAWSATSLDPLVFAITADFSESGISGKSAVNSYAEIL